MSRLPGPWRGKAAGLVLVLAGAFLYRFNTLGGTLGGFDNQHFLFLLYAREIQAGAQPLRDFLDAGLQGARPSLSYELPALAQQVFGANLLAEALLTAGALALAAAATYGAAAGVAPWPLALVTATVSVWVAPKLYSYPKVLVLAVVSLLVVRCARRPAWPTTGLLAAWTAVAFLFRHDLAVYCGLATLVVLAMVHGPRKALLHGAGYAAAATLLLLPSLWWIEQQRGLLEYLADARAMSARELERTDRDWPAFSLSGADRPSEWLTEANAEAWLYYACLGVPLIVLVSAAWRRVRQLPPLPGTPALVSLSAMLFLLVPVYLRGSLEARFGDVIPPVAVLGAALLAASLRMSGRRRAPAAASALAILAVSTASIWHLQSVASELRVSGLIESPGAVVRRAIHVSRELRGLPERWHTDPGGRATLVAAQYLRYCTRPSDRVLLVSFAPEVLAVAGRRFAGGRATFVRGFWASDRRVGEALDVLAGQEVPLALADPPSHYEASLPRLASFLDRHYREAGVVSLDSGQVLRILARRDRPLELYGPHRWPCAASAARPVGAARLE